MSKPLSHIQTKFVVTHDGQERPSLDFYYILN